MKHLRPENKNLEVIFNKVISGERITVSDGILLFEQAELGLLGVLAHFVRKTHNGLSTFYNRNFHIEPTNRCIYNCKFCSYNDKNSPETWDFSYEEMAAKVDQLDEKITEIHIVGGVHPNRGKKYYGELLKLIRNIRPELHLKAYSAIEISYMAKKESETVSDVLQYLKECGLDSIPGGGAEIFSPEIRKLICPEKDDASNWLHIHETAHNLGIPTNATILYGHIESYHHRVEHLDLIRRLQDKTNGFNAFIPLKFKNRNNKLSHVSETTLIEDLKNFAVTRIFLDNIQHLKAYWPMMGTENAQISLAYGVDDLDGTINDSTKIYTLAGSDEQHPEMSASKLSDLILKAGYRPVERDSLYRPVIR